MTTTLHSLTHLVTSHPFVSAFLVIVLLALIDQAVNGSHDTPDDDLPPPGTPPGTAI